jgi:hypothetical protein
LRYELLGEVVAEDYEGYGLIPILLFNTFFIGGFSVALEEEYEKAQEEEEMEFKKIENLENKLDDISGTAEEEENSVVALENMKKNTKSSGFKKIIIKRGLERSSILSMKRVAKLSRDDVSIKVGRGEG